MLRVVFVRICTAGMPPVESAEDELYEYGIPVCRMHVNTVNRK